MLLTALLIIAARSAPTPAPPPCSTTAGVKGVHLFLEAITPPLRDSVISVRLCLDPGKSGLGSYSVTITFDSSSMRVSRVDVSGGMQAANSNVPGSVRLAGAAPEGFARGTLATLTFRLLHRGALGKIRLTLVEANARSGSSLLEDARVDGYPANDHTLGVVAKPSLPGRAGEPSAASARNVTPKIDSIVPRKGEVDQESVLDLVVFGSGFGASDNSIQFDAASVTGLSSEGSGTIIRFSAPTILPEHGTTPMRRVQPGKYSVRVRTVAGTSNAVTFTAVPHR